MKLSFLIPFRDSDGTRTAGHQWLLKRWQHFYPDAEFCIAPDDGVDPFNKSLAVNNAAAQATGDFFVIVDADTWVDPSWMERSLEILGQGRFKWTAPSRHMRLKQAISNKVLAQDPTQPLPQFHPSRDTESFGHVVGFLWMVKASAWWETAWHNEQGQPRGMDERIRGWGGEDTAFRWAAMTVIGPPGRVPGTVVCLWHARPRAGSNRIWIGQDRTKEQGKRVVMAQYHRALRHPSAMREVLGQTNAR